MLALNTKPRFVDLSHWDDLQSIQEVKAAGILAVCNKITDGQGMVDTTYAIRKPVVLGAGLRYGGYHFLEPGDMVQQAEHYLNHMGDVKDLMLAGDWEKPSVSVLQARQWFGTVHDKVGRWPVCYSYASMLIEKFGRHNKNDFFANLKLWLAAYSAHPTWPTQIWANPWAWQFTGDGAGLGPHAIPGIRLPGSKGIDVDAEELGDMHATASDDATFLQEWAA